jgi:aminoglycoside phosphotransferase (APT) family kinase protein
MARSSVLRGPQREGMRSKSPLCRPGQADAATPVTACDLGRFLVSLRRLDTRVFAVMPGQRAVWRAVHALRDEAAAILGDRLTSSENQRIGRWWERFLSDPAMQEYRPAVRHGDLWHGNLLVWPGGAIAAVLDWETVAVADPAQDLALARYLGPCVTARVLDAYGRHGDVYGDQVRYRGWPVLGTA